MQERLEKEKSYQFHSCLLGANLSNLVGKMVIPAGFEPTACRLGGDRSILLSYGTIYIWLILLPFYASFGFFSYKSPLLISKRLDKLIGGGRTFSHAVR